MDTVTEARTAIAMAQEGGIGIIHRNLSIADQAMEVDKVKKSESGMILHPITMHPDQKIREALELMKKYRISGVPVTKKESSSVFLRTVTLGSRKGWKKRFRLSMTKDHLITVPVGTTLEDAKDILQRNRIEKLLVVDEFNNLKGLITIKDIEKMRQYPNSCKDQHGRLRVGAAIGVAKERMERASALLQVGVDVLVVDTAHGHSKDVLETVREIKEEFPDCQVIAGNVATQDGVVDLINPGRTV